LKAIIYSKFKGELKIENVPKPTVTSHGVVIKVTATGLCRSDWHGWMGHDPDIVLPHVPGHELAGVISEVGEKVKKFRIGERVTCPFVCGCGSCEQCDSGNQQICDHQSQPGFTHWGSFAEFVLIDNADINLVRIPPEISDITAAILGCRFITSYRAIVDQGRVKSGQFVAIHGCGGIGLSAIMISKAIGANVIAIDIDDKTLKFAEELGASMSLNALSEQDIPKAIIDLTSGGAHVSVDALGSQVTCINSIKSLRKRGKHIQIGLMTSDHSSPNVPMDSVMSNELEILGSHGMQAHRYPEMLQLIVEGKLQPNKIIEKTISLEQAIIELPNMDKFKNKGILVINSF